VSGILKDEKPADLPVMHASDPLLKQADAA
jgi:hypothetical protein